MTTVGYGDVYPVTPLGRGVATILMLLGIGLLAVVTATVAAYFVEQDEGSGRGCLAERRRGSGAKRSRSGKERVHA